MYWIDITSSSSLNQHWCRMFKHSTYRSLCAVFVVFRFNNPWICARKLLTQILINTRYINNIRKYTQWVQLKHIVRAASENYSVKHMTANTLPSLQHFYSLLCNHLIATGHWCTLEEFQLITDNIRTRQNKTIFLGCTNVGRLYLLSRIQCCPNPFLQRNHIIEFDSLTSLQYTHSAQRIIMQPYCCFIPIFGECFYL